MHDLVTKDDETDSPICQTKSFVVFPFVALFQHYFILSACNLFWFIPLLIAHVGYIVTISFNHRHLKYSTLYLWIILTITDTPPFLLLKNQKRLMLSNWWQNKFSCLWTLPAQSSFPFCGDLSVVGMERVNGWAI